MFWCVVSSESMEVDVESEEKMESSQQPSDAKPAASLNPSPEKSQKKYATAYKSFLIWQSKRGTKTISEKLLIEYFYELATQKKFKASTLWSHYSMLKMSLKPHKVYIARFFRLKNYLKGLNSTAHQANLSNVLTASQINAFIDEAPDDQYLLTKVALIFGLLGACRRHELHRTKVTDLVDSGSSVSVSIPDSKTNLLRKFTITGRLYKIYRKYAELRPPLADNSSFFLNHRTAQPVGINYFGNMAKEIATYLNLPRPSAYNGHCFRLSSTSIVVDADGCISDADEKEHDGSKDEASENCDRSSSPEKLQVVYAIIDDAPSVSSELLSTSL